MKCCFGQFLLYRPKYCLHMLRRQALEVLFKTIQGSALVCHKNWSAEESQKSSTWKELVAIYFAIEAFDNHLAGQTVACNTDNQNFVLIIQAGSMFEVIYQTRATVFHRDIQTPRRELKIRRAAEYF